MRIASSDLRETPAQLGFNRAGALPVEIALTDDTDDQRQVISMTVNFGLGFAAHIKMKAY